MKYKSNYEHISSCSSIHSDDDYSASVINEDETTVIEPIVNKKRRPGSQKPIKKTKSFVNKIVLSCNTGELFKARRKTQIKKTLNEQIKNLYNNFK